MKRTKKYPDGTKKMSPKDGDKKRGPRKGTNLMPQFPIPERERRLREKVEDKYKSPPNMGPRKIIDHSSTAAERKKRTDMLNKAIAEQEEKENLLRARQMENARRMMQTPVQMMPIPKLKNGAGNIQPVTSARKKKLLLKGAHDSPKATPHIAHDAEFGSNVVKYATRYSYGSRGVKPKKYAAGIAAIGAKALLGGAKAGGASAAGGGGMNLGSMMQMGQGLMNQGAKKKDALLDLANYEEQKVNEYEKGTSYFTGYEDHHGPVVFGKKNPLRKWDNMGKALKLGMGIAGTASAMTNPLSSKMHQPKGTAAEGAPREKKTLKQRYQNTKEDVGNAYKKTKGWVERTGKNIQHAGEEVNDFMEPKVDALGQKISKFGHNVSDKFSQTFKKKNQADNLTNRANTITPDPELKSLSPLTNKGMMELGTDPLGQIKPYKKGTKKLKIKKTNKRK